MRNRHWRRSKPRWSANGNRQVFKELFTSGVSKPLLIGVVLAVFQQWCGINVIFNYAQEVFSAAGFPISDMLFNIVVTGTVNLAFTLVAMATVDRFGRRILMLGGAAGPAVIYLALGAAHHAHIHGTYTVALVVAAIACNAVSCAGYLGCDCRGFSPTAFAARRFL